MIPGVAAHGALLLFWWARGHSGGSHETDGIAAARDSRLIGASVTCGPRTPRLVSVTIHERPQDADHDGRYESLDIDARLPIGRPGVTGHVWGNLRIATAPDSSSAISMFDVPGTVVQRMSHQAIRFPTFVTDDAGIATVHLSCTPTSRCSWLAL